MAHVKTKKTASRGALSSNQWVESLSVSFADGCGGRTTCRPRRRMRWAIACDSRKEGETAYPESTVSVKLECNFAPLSTPIAPHYVRPTKPRTGNLREVERANPSG